MSGMKDKFSTIDSALGKANSLVDIMTARENRRRSVIYFVLIVIVLIGISAISQLTDSDCNFWKPGLIYYVLEKHM